jgi:hypothetical protein
MGGLLSLFKPQVQVGRRRLTVLRRLGEGGFGIVDLVQVRVSLCCWCRWQLWIHYIALSQIVITPMSRAR